MAKLDGKVALITGAAAGLGEGISTAYAKYGSKADHGRLISGSRKDC